ncbi:MAG: formylglycine-generating enzyme family protein [Myxococcota bacterium]|nr:formylglycine-generating enzyme family protein [Myxococcota bacterium]
MNKYFVVTIAVAISWSFLFDGATAQKSSFPNPEPCETAPKGMSCIPGGPFVRGTDDGPPDTQPKANVYVSTFFMDQYAVTFEEYNACIVCKECPFAKPNYKDFNHPHQPMTGVSWYNAVKFCEAHGKHLPTEAQWEKAARGTDGRLHPWGDEPATCERAVIMDDQGRSCGKPNNSRVPERGRPDDVGSRPAGIFELFDMVGNSWQWVYDWYSRSYAECGKDCEGVDPKGPCGGDKSCHKMYRRVVRGGSWYWGPEMATSVYRRAHFPRNEPFHHFGFRCAASVEQARALVKAQGEKKAAPPRGRKKR